MRRAPSVYSSPYSIVLTSAWSWPTCGQPYPVQRRLLPSRRLTRMPAGLWPQPLRSCPCGKNPDRLSWAHSVSNAFRSAATADSSIQSFSPSSLKREQWAISEQTPHTDTTTSPPSCSESFHINIKPTKTHQLPGSLRSAHLNASALAPSACNTKVKAKFLVAVHRCRAGK